MGMKKLLLILLATLALAGLPGSPDARLLHGIGIPPAADSTRQIVGTKNDLSDNSRPTDGIINSLNFIRYTYCYQPCVDTAPVYSGITKIGGGNEGSITNQFKCTTALQLPDTTITQFGSTSLTVLPSDNYKLGSRATGTTIAVGGAWVRGHCTVGARLGSITAAGSGYTNGVYTSVPMSGGTGTGETATVTITGNRVTGLVLDCIGQGYTVGDVLSANAADLGGAGSGLQYTVSANGLFFLTDYFNNSTFGDYTELGVSVTDKTTTGTIISSGTYTFFPNLEGTTTGARTVAIVGDSISVGVGGFRQPLTGGAIGVGYGGGIGYIAGYLDGRKNYVHFGESGDAVLIARTHYSRRAQYMALGQFTDIADELAINDLRGGQTAVSLTANQGQLLTNIKSFAPQIANIWGFTPTPSTVNSDNPSPCLSTNQTITPAPFSSTEWDTYSATVRALGLPGQTGLVDASPAIQNNPVTNPHIWADGFCLDGIHPTQSGGVALVNKMISDGAMPKRRTGNRPGVTRRPVYANARLRYRRAA